MNKYVDVKKLHFIEGITARNEQFTQPGDRRCEDINYC